jgi:8-oxo-dGTP pyrophosphatase MutT (NUDIX family)
MSALITRLETRLAQIRPQVRAEWEARPAAVLVPLFEHGGEWHVVLTQRTETLSSHRGQVAFPGGRIDAQDADAIGAALREAEEEIGLRPADVRVLGTLDQLLTVTQWRITPVVSVIPWPYTFAPNSAELSAVFSVPLAFLRDPANLVTETRQPLAPGLPIPVYHWYYNGYDIWGASARILLNLLELM